MGIFDDDIFNQMKLIFSAARYKSKQFAENCMIHDFCLLKKTQESLLARAYKDSCNVVVFISCTDTRLFYAVGTLINEPLELLYLNEEQKKTLNVDQLRESYQLFVKVKWMAKNTISYDIATGIDNPFNESKAVFQSKEVQELPGDRALRLHDLIMQGKPFKIQEQMNCFPKTNFPIIPYPMMGPGLMNFGQLVFGSKIIEKKSRSREKTKRVVRKSNSSSSVEKRKARGRSRSDSQRRKNLNKKKSKRSRSNDRKRVKQEKEKKKQQVPISKSSSISIRKQKEQKKQEQQDNQKDTYFDDRLSSSRSIVELSLVRRVELTNINEPIEPKTPENMSPLLEDGQLSLQEQKIQQIPLPPKQKSEETPTKSMQVIKQGVILFSSGLNCSNGLAKGVISIQRSNQGPQSAIRDRLIQRKN